MSDRVDVWAPKAQALRRDRVSAFTQFLLNSEGQEISTAMRVYSRQTGISLRTLDEYWEVLSGGNRGPLYEKHGIIKVRAPFRKWLKGKGG